jgi:hypothetical protein
MLWLIKQFCIGAIGEEIIDVELWIIKQYDLVYLICKLFSQLSVALLLATQGLNRNECKLNEFVTGCCRWNAYILNEIL